MVARWQTKNLQKARPKSQTVGINGGMLLVKDFLESGKHLPSFLRDFHNQKDVCKTLWCCMDKSSFPKEIQTLGWVNFHIIIIDIFLWWMAKRGWTLQRSRQKVEFLDVNEDIKKYKDEQTEVFKKFLEERRCLKN